MCPLLALSDQSLTYSLFFALTYVQFNLIHIANLFCNVDTHVQRNFQLITYTHTLNFIPRYV